MSESDIQTIDLREQLGILRSVLSGSPNGRYLDLFDEFMREHEFGLALHTVCDYILEPDTPPVSGLAVERIENLHAAMKMQDDCIEKLVKKQAV
jgi:hypothetical protein